MEMDEVLSDEPKEEAQEEAVVEAPKVELKPEVEEMTAKEKAAFAKASDERNKRQEWERKYNDLSREHEELKKPKQPASAFYEQPEKYMEDYRQQLNEDIFKAKVDMSEASAKRTYPDYADNVAVFADLVKNTPGLIQQFRAAADPAEFAYKTGKAHNAIKEAGDVDAYKAKLKAELKAELEAEAQAKKKAKDDVPDSLSDARGHSSKKVFSGPPPLSSVFGE
jgi:hypothetical protein